MWDAEATDLARRLHMSRPSRTSGTTILVVGFRDPTDDEPRELPQLLQRIRESAARFFWPAMNFPRPLRIVVGGEPVTESEEVADFAAAWRQRTHPRTRLENPGDVSRRQLPLTVPRRRKDRNAPEVATCDLIVRLAEPDPQRVHSPHDNKLALFRGPGMVVKYYALDPAGTLPRFHAILACGEGRDPEHATPSDQQAEAFLRKCEPPGHDEWSATPRLRDDYVKGGGVSLDQLLAAARNAVRELLLEPTGDARRGPDLLQRRFPLGAVGNPSAAATASPFHFIGLTAEFINERWQFSGSVAPVAPGHAWTATITLKMLGDDGSEAGRLKIADFILGDCKGGKHERTDDGAVRLSASKAVATLAFSGSSEPLPGHDQLCELGLEIAGELHPKGGV
jgi:hypothetical protein